MPDIDKVRDLAGGVLVANAGNTNLRLAYYELGGQTSPTWERRLPTAEAATAELPTPPPGCGIVIVSVVPAIAAHLSALWQAHTPIHVSAATAGLAIAYEPPTALGADRLANVVAVHAAFGAGIAVDCGTATTLTVVDAAGVVRGGAILPGLATQRDSLFSRTAQLPEVPLAGVTGPWGTSTFESIQLGVVEGHVGAIRHLAGRMEAGLAGPVALVLTGGYSQLLAPLLPRFVHRPDLTLEGARRVYVANRPFPSP